MRTINILQKVCKNNAPLFRSLTSLHPAEFAYLLSCFEPLCEAHYKWHRLDGKKRKLPRLRPHAKELLPSAAEKLFFLLVYQKNNPLQTFQEACFGMSQTQVSPLFSSLNVL